MNKAIMDGEAREKVGRVFREVLERQAFMFADPADPGDPASPEGDFLAASIAFRGEVEGRVTLVVPGGMAVEIASNILGADPSDPQVQARARDACKELLNVICGHILTSLRGEEPVFDLSIPEVAEAGPETVAFWAGRPESLAFSVEGEPVLLVVAFGPDPAGGTPG